MPSVSFANSTTDTTDLHRFTAGWTKQYRKGWNLNGLELAWKIPEKKSLFKLSLNGSKHKSISSEAFSGDAAIEFADSIRIEFGDAYKLIHNTDSQLWLISLAYEMYPWEKSGQWWKLDWDFYPSFGLNGQYELTVSSSDYFVEFFPAGSKESLTEKLGIPTGLTKSEFEFIFPACLNFDISIVTFRTCGLFYVKDNPSISVTISGGL